MIKTFLISILSLSAIVPSCTQNVWARKARTITCFKKWPQTVRVPLNDVMSLEFPDKPGETVPGVQHFSFTFVKNDIHIKSLSSRARANFFVYINGLRCSFKLITTTNGSDDIVIVRYPKSDSVEVKYGK